MNKRLNDHVNIQAPHDETPVNSNLQVQLTGKMIEDALINAKKWEVDNLQNAIPINEIIKLYLGCDPGKVYRHDIDYRPPMMNNYLANLLPYIESEYRVRDDVIIDQLDNNTNEFNPTWGFTRCRRGSAFMGNTSTVIGGKVFTLAGPGYIFIEDPDGFRIIVFVSSIKQIGSDIRVSIILFAAKLHVDAKVKLIRFLNGFENFNRRNRIYSSGAFDIDGNGIELSPVPWEALKVSDTLKATISTHITGYISHLDDFRKEGIRASRGIILTGKPGNGKTLLGRILATNIGIPMIWVTAQQLTVGFGMNNACKKLYQFAEMIAPVIILIEDADIFLENRQRNQYSTQLSELLNRIDGIKVTSGVITIITANNPEMLDEAVGNRPKRFDVIIEFPNPAAAQRLEILDDIAGKRTRPEEHFLLEDVADRLEGYSAAHVTEFAERLVMAAVFEGREFINEIMVNRELHNFGFKQMEKKVSGFM